jgi:UDP-N-acetylglucosamine 2-epimerase (non-hydrolysing)
MIKVMCIFGTRPEAIKLAPLIREFKKRQEHFKVIVCVTAQHRSMLDQVLYYFQIKPDIDLNLMRNNQTLDVLTSVAITALTKVLLEQKPDIVLVQGDTTTSMAAALASFYQKIPVGHVEAGLRTKNIYDPFPEEVNRRIISVLSTYNFAPTKNAMEALLAEGIPQKSISLTGNTIVDALYLIIQENRRNNIDFSFLDSKKIILVTAHRRESFGKPLENICLALSKIAERNPQIKIVYPVHPNPNVKDTVFKILMNKDRIHLLSPLEYPDFVYLLNRSYLVLTDSGGVQEEAPVLGKPVLVMRNETERPEGIEANVAKLVGTNTEDILSNTELLLNEPKEYAKMSRAVSLYGDGKASERIAKIILHAFGYHKNITDDTHITSN